MTQSLSGKVAVITGGSRNIGKAVAAEMIARGAKVVIGDLLEAEGQKTVEEFNAKAGSKVAAFIKTNVVTYEDNTALFKFAESEFGGVDIAFLNAGIGSNANTIFMPLDNEVDDRMLDVNTMGVIKGTKVAVLHMAKRGGGVIVNTASVASFLTSPSVSIYTASKFAVAGWTRSFSLLPQVCNVRVNAVCPYWVETDLAHDLSNRAHGGDPFQKLVEKSPRTKVETVVEAVLTLVEDDKRNCETLLALPNNVIRPQEPIQPYAEIIGENGQALFQEYAQESVEFYKKSLAEAMKAYGF